ncbi:C2 domain-containing protein [Histoplasma ohiense]|nr:C2 domain-containing protein [Histoplasma ohiense (nom. inval.)]
MSTASSRSRGFSRRLDSDSGQSRGPRSRNVSVTRKRPVSHNDAYLYVLRVAYLAYLLQKRPRRTQSVPIPRQRAHKSSASIISDLSLVKDHKSTRLPHGFVGRLENRLTGVFKGIEKEKAYQDEAVRRTFAAFLNELREPGFNKRMREERRAEPLVLIFFSNATKELSKGQAPDDTNWKLMVDRHVALFVRIISLILKDQGWDKDKPELASQLSILETKLLAHDQNLAQASPKDGGNVITELVPLSYKVEDMPLVQVVAKLFGLRNSYVQSDINKYKDVWTAKAALQDLKTYQVQLNLNTRRTLSNEDFDSMEAFEAWKKAEDGELSQMMFSIMQSNPDTKTSLPGGTLSHLSTRSNDPNASDLGYSDTSDIPSIDAASFSQPDASHDCSDNPNIYTFIPPDPRSFYRFVLLQVVNHELQERSTNESDSISDSPPKTLLSKQATDLLSEISLRWRIPTSTRAVLFLDVFREKYVEQEIDLDTLDSAFIFVNQPPPEKSKRGSNFIVSLLSNRENWTLADFSVMTHLLSSLHEALLRHLYETMMHCYDTKVPPIGSVMYILENYVEADPNFVSKPDDYENFRSYVYNGLVNKAKEVYQEHLDKEIPPEQNVWEFYHVVQLGKGILKLAQRIQKRYKKNPEIIGVNPSNILAKCVLPMFAEDARDIITRIIQQAQDKNEEIGVQDGFDLYKELAQIRQFYTEVLPGEPFPIPIEELLSNFVWRWIQATDEKIVGWVNEAIKQDDFKVRIESPTDIPTQDQRHSLSVVDVFRSFNEVINQIVQLNWDDDVGYAKFMTAISKSIGKGIARYCEVLELQFSREMDRLTPEQEASLSQSRQEKWMQMAKEAWNNKEKIEPFHFFPQSFVKLNNIEYALHQLDKLEKDVNVDACADVLAKNTPPALQRPRKVTNYVFTVKIVEAEDLKGCDMDGLSDPYVSLADESQRIFKTRIIYDNLNPRWDDSVDIITKGPQNIIATVWDWDAVGSHDYMGRTSLKLDPAHFSDFVPREYWLDLDTQGRILLRVSMEGERDDIQFHFGKAFRTLKRTEREMTRKTTEKLSAYINHCLSRRSLKALLSKGITMSTVSSYFNRNKTPTTSGPTPAEIEGALDPLFTYFDDNFSIMNQTLTEEAMRTVMARLWKEVLVTVEALLVPPLSDKPSNQRPLTQREVDVVSRWLLLLLNFFNAVDEETGEANGVPLDILKSPKYHEIQSLFFFYFEPTDSLIRTSERMASSTAARQQTNRNRLSTTSSSLSPFSAIGGAAGIPSARRGKSIMLSRNLGTMRKAKEEKWREAQAEPNDDMVLRILRMRPEAHTYIRDRSRQKERLATAAAADLIVKQSLMAGGGGRMVGTLPRR